MSRAIAPVVAILILLTGVAYLPSVPAATPITFPTQDTFDVDSIGNGDWETYENAPMTMQVANGDLTMAREDGVGPGGGGVRRPWTSTSDEVTVQVRVTPQVVYRFGVGLLQADGRNIFLEAPDIGWLVSFDDASGYRQFAHLNLGVSPGFTYLARLVLRIDGSARAEVWDSDGTNLLGATETHAGVTTPANVATLNLQVWRDASNNPLSSYVVHDLQVTSRALQLDPANLINLPGTVVSSFGLLSTPTLPAWDNDTTTASHTRSSNVVNEDRSCQSTSVGIIVTFPTPQKVNFVHVDGQHILWGGGYDQCVVVKGVKADGSWVDLTTLCCWPIGNPPPRYQIEAEFQTGTYREIVLGLQPHYASPPREAGLNIWEMKIMGKAAPAPAAPANVTAEPGPGARQITVEWEHEGAFVDAFDVFRDGARIASVASANRSFVESGLAPGTTYSYAVKATNAWNESVLSEEVEATTFPPPSEPRNLTAQAAPFPEGSVTLNWDPPAERGGPDAPSYRIYRRHFADGVQRIAGTTSETTFTDRFLATGDYHYEVRTLQAGWEGDPSLPAATFVVSGWASPPEGLTVQAGPTSAEADLSWGLPEEGEGLVDRYEVIDHHPNGTVTVLSAGRAHGATLRLRGEGSHAFTVRSVTWQGAGRPTEAVSLAVGRPVIVGLGDSVASGHGLGPGAGAPNNPGAHPRQLGERFGAWTSDYAISGACAMSPGFELPAVGMAEPNTPASCTKSIGKDQLLPLAPLNPGDPAPSLVTISAGADDIEFSACIAYFMSFGLSTLKDGISGNTAEDPCADDTLREHLDAFDGNMRLVVNYIRRLYGTDTPIAITQYYNPFPSQEQPACGVWMPPAALSSSYETFRDEAAWERQLMLIQQAAYERADHILGALNGAIASLADLGLVVVPAPDFTGHDVCRGERDLRAGIPVDLNQVWAFPTEVHVRMVHSESFLGPQSEFQRDFFPVAETCDPQDDPGDTDLLLPHWDTFTSIRVQVHVNCFPHPTLEGQSVLASAIQRVIVLDGPT